MKDSQGFQVTWTHPDGPSMPKRDERFRKGPSEARESRSVASREALVVQLLAYGQDGITDRWIREREEPCTICLIHGTYPVRLDWEWAGAGWILNVLPACGTGCAPMWAWVRDEG